MDLSLFLNFWYKSPLIKSNSVWNTMVFDKALSFGINKVDRVLIELLMGKEGKSISSIMVYSSENESSPPLWRKEFI